MSQLQKVSIQSPSRNTTEDDEAAAQLMARWYTAWCTHDPVAIMACLTEDAVLEEPNGAYRGHQAIADVLVISGRAVEKHVSSIFTKLNLPPAPEDHRRVLAVLAFLRS